MPEISVIIPIYNVEQYLSRCLDSVINQTYKNLEIICVNDCSPDNSLKILEDYEKKDKRIKIINRPQNGGLSAARNTGLEAANGDYIYFLDSDDWIDLDYIELMTDAANKNKARVVLNTKILSHGKNKLPYQFYATNTLNNVKDTFLNAKMCTLNIIWNSWAYLFKREFLEKINVKFPQGCINEDVFFQAAVFAYLDKVYVIRKSGYNYLLRNDSISGKIKPDSTKNLEKNLIILNKIYDFLQERNLLNTKTRLFSSLIAPLAKDHEILNREIQMIKKFFEKTKDYIEFSKELYSLQEYNFFKDVLENADISIIKNYYAKFTAEKLRGILSKEVIKCSVI